MTNECALCGGPAEESSEKGIFGEPELICRNKDCLAGQPKPDPTPTTETTTTG